MILTIPVWIQILLAGALGFWLKGQYDQWHKDPKAFWKEWFD
ncbi:MULTISPECIES: hypothetical protein [Lentilactobacillus]|nr:MULTISPECIES: hypothetical protein [Lentilactobacillus]